MKVAFLTRYANLGASSRVRAYQFASALAALGIEASFWPLLSDRYLSLRYANQRAPLEVLACYWKRVRDITALRSADILWIEKELLPYVPAKIEEWLIGARRYVLDLDDAIFHNYDLAGSIFVRSLLGRKIDRLMKGATLVTAGNAYLANRATAAGSRRVEQLPSVVDLGRYRTRALASVPARADDATLRVVWIGSPSTVRYLELVREPFERAARERSVSLHVIGAVPPRWHGVETVSVAWSVQSEATAIAACDVGIMPLSDTPWERGKCGYKLIQYMACGLPVIASPVGINVEIVAAGTDGFLAATDSQWTEGLLRLARDPDLRRQMGAQGRAKVERDFSVQAVAPRMAALLKEAAG